MARVMKLIPKWDKTREKWVLNLPPALSDTGKRKRLIFSTEAEALSRAATLKDARRRFGDLARRIDPELLKTSIQYNEVAIEFGFSGLRELCAKAISRVENESRSPHLATLLQAWEADHAGNWSPGYLSKRWRPFKARISDLGGTPISKLGEDFWRKWFAEWRKASAPAASTYNQQLGILKAIFSHSLAKASMPENPLDAIPLRKDDNKEEVPVHSVEEVRRLMEAAWEFDRELVPYFAVCYFAGLRPDSEAHRCRFEDLDREAKHQLVRVSKTGRGRRFVDASDALLAWLAPWAGMKGSILPANFKIRRRRLIYGFYTTSDAELNNEKAWEPLVPWEHDITRHSYGSYFEGAHRNEPGCRERLAANMGHRDYKTFDSYYKNARPAAEALLYWQIFPSVVEGNVRAIA